MVYKVGERQMWAPHRAWWITFAAGCLGAAVLPWWVSTRDAVHRPGGAYVFFACLVASLIFGAFLYRVLLWSRLIVDKDGLTVRNPFKTRRITWREIASIEARGIGCHVITRDDSIVVVWALAVPTMEGGTRIGADRTQEVVRFLEGWRQTELPMCSPE